MAERDERAGEPHRDRPPDLLPGDAGELRQLERREGVGSGAEPAPVGHADEDERTHAGSDQARDQDQGKRRATEPGGLDDEDCGHDRRAEDDRDGGEAAGRGEHGHELRRCVAPDEAHRVHREAGAERDEGRLGAEDEPEADGRPRGQHHARDDARLGAAHLQAVGRHMPSRSRQADDRERHRQAGDAEHEQVPPRRNRVPPEAVRQIREQPLLGVVHDLEERPRDERDDDPDDGSEHQDRDEVPAPQDRQGIGRRSGRCGRVASSCHLLPRSVDRTPGLFGRTQPQCPEATLNRASPACSAPARSPAPADGGRTSAAAFPERDLVPAVSGGHRNNASPPPPRKPWSASFLARASSRRGGFYGIFYRVESGGAITEAKVRGLRLACRGARVDTSPW